MSSCILVNRHLNERVSLDVRTIEMCNEETKVYIMTSCPEIGGRQVTLICGALVISDVTYTVKPRYNVNLGSMRTEISCTVQ